MTSGEMPVNELKEPFRYIRFDVLIVGGIEPYDVVLTFPSPLLAFPRYFWLSCGLTGYVDSIDT